MISACIAPVCNSLVATDYSDGMLRNAKENCKAFGNVKIEKGDIMHLPYADGSFDKVVAANVIHLLDKPELALAELMRVCRKDGMVIIPTYVFSKRSWFARSFMKIVNCFTKTFVNQFSEESYKEFFKRLGYSNASFDIVEGRMACAIAFLPL
jgi:ubiquinone/menaquinone biosynthesis C-methylase UbiE